MSLHDPAKGNPYLEIMDILEPALSHFDSDGTVPVFRFGCKTSKDKVVVPLLDDTPADFSGLSSVMRAYNSAVSTVRMSGPTSFAPVI